MKILLSLINLLIPCLTLINILNQGAILHTDTLAAQFKNSAIIKQSIQKANSSKIQKVIKIPKGTFYIMPIVLHNIHNVSIILQGKLSASKKVLAWTKKPNSAHYQDILYIADSSNIQISGGGKIDGRGYHWWMIQWMRLKKLRPANSARPHMINIQRCNNFSIHDIILKNSPCFHLRTYQCQYFNIYNLDIKVNTTAQFNLAKNFTPQGIVPLFPLNTDGIDPAGRYFHIYNITVQNYDDVVVPKPSHKNTNCNCTQFMLIQNITIRLGVGLSIGSVPPNTNHNCIRNIIFKNAYFQKPFKAIYLKTNPGTQGSGEIINITYQNMIIKQPIWWAIYLGPQQQKQPMGGGPGCMLYPFDPRGTCQTQPRIDIRNITLENITVYNSLLFPVVLRCNQTNPCTGIQFNNVKINKWFIGKKKQGFACENIKGRQEGGHPRINCLTEGNNNIKKQQIQYNNNEQQKLSIKQIWNKLQQHINSIKYQQQDDEMNISQEIIEALNNDIKIL